MNYEKHYEKLIERGKSRKLECYKEKHHIVPRCLGGTDEKENLVELTAREHFIAHILLVKINPRKYGLIKAVNMMCCIGEGQDRSMNRMYGWLREKLSESMSESQKGDKNSQFSTMWIYNVELRESKKVPKGEIPIGWIKGRKLNFDLDELNRKKKEELKSSKEEYIKTQLIFVNEVLDVIEEKKFESIAELLRNGYYSDYYSSKLSNILKRYNLERYQTLIKPRFLGKKHRK